MNSGFMKALPENNMLHSRRDFLRNLLLAGTGSSMLPLLNACDSNGGFKDSLGILFGLQSADENGVKLPLGFQSRIVARSGAVLGKSAYRWHDAPDGGACFPLEKGGWIYVSNSELESGLGGAGAIKFDARGNIKDAYPILTGTTRNCAGGATPWKTWLSCEESGDFGRVFECDPFGINPPLERPALGRFNHEAVAVNPESQFLYLTEDLPDGGFYRFKPENLDEHGFADLSSGKLQIAEMIFKNGAYYLRWHDLPDPLATEIPTRQQIPDVTTFNGGEGIVCYENIIYFSTKGDNKIWAYDTGDHLIMAIYDASDYEAATLSGVDNMAVSATGNLIVAEDGGNLQIVLVSPQGDIKVLLQLEGHNNSEITGPALSPDGTRLYFSSQRGRSGLNEDGITFEIRLLSDEVIC